MQHQLIVAKSNTNTFHEKGGDIIVSEHIKIITHYGSSFIKVCNISNDLLNNNGNELHDKRNNILMRKDFDYNSFKNKLTTLKTFILLMLNSISKSIKVIQ